MEALVRDLVHQKAHLHITAAKNLVRPLVGVPSKYLHDDGFKRNNQQKIAKMKAVSQIITMLQNMLNDFDEVFSSELRLRNYKPVEPVEAKASSWRSRRKSKR